MTEFDNSEITVTKLSKKLFDVSIPLAMELEVKSGSDLYDSIMEFSGFQKYISKTLEETPETGKISRSFDLKIEAAYEKLKKDIVFAGKPKITIKIELEKYE